MTTTEVRRPPRHPDAPAPGPPAARTPLVAALVVMLLWGVWLLVPEGVRLDLLGGAPVDRPAGSTGLSGAGAGTDAGADGMDPAVDAAGDPAAGSAEGAAPGPGAAEPGSSGPEAVGPEASEDPAAEDAEDAAEDPAVQARAADPGVEPAPDPAAPDADPVEVPQAGDGTFAVAPGTGAVVGSGELVRYTVEVEGGVPLDPAQVASVVDRVLADPRSWTAEGRWSLQRVDADPDARIVVASPDTTDRLCAPLRTRGQVSCRNGDDVVINANRWTRGATSWGDDVAGYQEYVVNHELGHFLGNGHGPCPAAGQPAPVMLQQTIGLDGCAPNAWPYP